MKKTSTLALSLLLAAGAWCGLAYAAEGDTPAAAEQQTATFDFKTKSYGQDYLSGNDYATTTMTGTEGDITMTVSGKYRLWNSDKTLRLYKADASMAAAKVVFTAAEDATITKVTFDGSKLTNLALPEGAAGELTSGVWTGSSTSVTFDAKDGVNINSIVVEYTGGTPDTRKEPNLMTNAQPEYTVVLGSNWYGPYFYVQPYEIAIEYTSSNPEVVSVSEWGQPELKGVGEATITATTVATEEYKSVSKSYKVTVLPEGTVFNSKDGEGFELAEPWVINTQYNCLYANAYNNGTYTAYQSMTTSAEINITENSSAVLTFDNAIGFINGKTAAEYCKVFVAVVEGEDNSDPDFGGYGDVFDGEETEETPTELNWVEIPNVIPTPADNKYTWTPITIDLGTEYAGQTIKVGFEYTSTTEFGCGWEIKNISVVCTDLLKPLKDAAYEEVCKYGELLGDDLNPYMLQGWKRTINDCTSEDEINEAIEYILSQITGSVYANMEMNFTWSVGEDKVATYVADAAAGTSPWQGAEFTMNSLFNCERVNDPGMSPWAADAKSADEPSEDAFYIQNVATGLYVAAPTTVGAPVAATDDKEQAGIFVLKCTNDVIALTDDASGHFITFDATKGMILSETPELIKVDALNIWDKDEAYNISASFPGAETQGREEVIDVIETIQIAVSPEAELSGIGGITLTTFDKNWNRVTLLNLTAAALATITPEKGEGYNTEWVQGEPTQVPFEANVYTIALRSKITDGGNYNLEVAEGTFVVDTKDGKVFSPEAYASVTILANETEEGFAPVVTPAAGEVEQLDKFVIEAPEDGEGILGVYWSDFSDAKITLASATEIIAEWTKDQIDAANTRDLDDFSSPDKYELTLEQPVMDNGEYVLTIPEGVFEDVNYNFNGLTEITYTVNNGQVQISDITVNGRSVMYDLQGRRINGNARGIVISNGKKVLVK